MIDHGRLSTLIQLVARLEKTRSFVSQEDVIAAATQEQTGATVAAGEVAGLLAVAVQAGVLFTDTRTVLDSERGEFRDTRLYRLNHRHATVQALREHAGKNEPTGSSEA